MSCPSDQNLNQYTALHIFRQVLFGSGNQGNHQNFEKSLLHRKKKEIFKIANLQKIFAKISQIGPWLSRIDWFEGHWCNSTYMAWGCPTYAQKWPKNTKNVFFACFRAYVGQPLNHIGWTTSMPFASINPTNPRTNPWNFHRKTFRIWGVENLFFFWVGYFEVFFSNKQARKGFRPISASQIFLDSLYSLGILWEFFVNSSGMYCWGFDLGIFCEFFVNSIIILMNFFGILLEFFWNSLGILWEFFGNSIGIIWGCMVGGFWMSGCWFKA